MCKCNFSSAFSLSLGHIMEGVSLIVFKALFDSQKSSKYWFNMLLMRCSIITWFYSGLFFFFIGVDRFAYCLVHTPSKSFEQEQRFILCFQSLFLNYFHSLSLTVAPHILVALLPSLGCNDFKNKKKIFLKSLNFYIGFYYFPHLLLCLKPVEEPLGICWTMST